MATRDILNYQGSVIGSLTLPDETTEAQWTDALSPYLEDPSVALRAAIIGKIEAAKKFGAELMNEFAADNILAGYNTSQVLGIASKLAGVQALLVSGSLYGAIIAIQSVAVDSVITQEVKDKFVAKIHGFLGA